MNEWDVETLNIWNVLIETDWTQPISDDVRKLYTKKRKRKGNDTQYVNTVKRKRMT